MHLSSSGALTLAATDLGRFLACRHVTGLDVEVAFGRRAKPPKFRVPSSISSSPADSPTRKSHHCSDRDYKNLM